jgi:predicted transcriptional regulator
MADANKIDFGNPAPLLEEEDEETLAAIDRGIKAADEGRVVPSSEFRRRVQEWLTRSSTPKTR